MLSIDAKVDDLGWPWTAISSICLYIPRLSRACLCVSEAFLMPLWLPCTPQILPSTDIVRVTNHMYICMHMSHLCEPL